MTWIETTERNSVICDDMFISQFHNEFTIVWVNNGTESRRSHNQQLARELIGLHQLEKRNSDIFTHASSYRTKNGWAVIDALLKAQNE